MANFDRINFSKLTGEENWQSWKYQLTCYIRGNGLWGYIDGTTKKPENKKDDEWNEKNWKLISIIVQSLDEKPFALVQGLENAQLVWEKLQGVYEMCSVDRKMALLIEFYGANWDNSDDIITHITKVQNLRKQIKDLGEPTYNETIIAKILSNLPSAYDSFVEAWRATSKSEQTISFFTERLVATERRLKMREDETTLAFAASRQMSKIYIKENKTGSSAKQSQGQQKQNENVNYKKKTVCHFCGKAGHYSVNCWYRKQSGANVYKKAPTKMPNGTSAGKMFSVGRKSDYFKSSDIWYADSGASDHMTSRLDWFTDYKQLTQIQKIRCGNGTFMEAVGFGRIDIEVEVNGVKSQRYLEKVLYVPQCCQSLISVGRALDAGFKQEADGRKWWLTDKSGFVIMEGKRHGQMTQIHLRVLKPKYAAVVMAEKRNDLQFWHERLAHQHKRHILKFLQVNGIKVTGSINEKCEACIINKLHQKSYKQRFQKAIQPGELIHADLCGPMQTTSLNGTRFMFLLKDDYSHFRTVYFLKHKSEVKEVLPKFFNKVKNETDFRVKVIRTDRGTEFTDVETLKEIEKYGVSHVMVSRATPQQNGTIERENRTIIEAARTMLNTKGLNKNLWAEACNTAVITLNVTGTSTENNKTPFELWYRRKPRIENLRIFGSKAFVLVPNAKRQKLDPKARVGMFIGYDDCGYRILYEDSQKIDISMNVEFDEQHGAVCNVQNNFELQYKQTKTAEISQVSKKKDDIFSCSGSEKEEEKERKEEEKEKKEEREEKKGEKEKKEEREEKKGEREEKKEREGERQKAQEIENKKSQEIENKKSQENKRYPSRNRKPPKRIYESNSFLAELMDEPTYEEAMNSSDSEKWNEAMKSEMQSLISNGTWSLVNPPSSARILTNKWVLRIKRFADGSVDRYKARLVVRGFAQRQGIDYEDTFSPVARFESIRLLLATAASKRLHLKQFDVKTAFLHGDLEEDIYMYQPHGFEDKSRKVCKLIKSLYGLKQAPKCWSKKFACFLQNQKLKQSDEDPCIFTREVNKKILILAIYVDDGIIASTDKCDGEELLVKLNKQFEMKSGNLSEYLGLQIDRFEDGSIFLHQSGYVQRILQKFNMIDAKPVSTPLTTEKENVLNNNNNNNKPDVPYRQAVGSLMYLMVGSRPDIAYAVSRVSQFLDTYTENQWKQVKHILRYLKNTSSLGLLFKANLEHDLSRIVTFADADFGGDLQTRKSTSGWTMMYNGTAIQWGSKRQQRVTLSTMEAEYVAASDAARETIWLHRLAITMAKVNEKPLMLVDNQSAIVFSKLQEIRTRSKHIDIRKHFLRELVTEGDVEIQYISTAEQTADIMTKALSWTKFEYHRNNLGINDMKKLALKPKWEC